MKLERLKMFVNTYVVASELKQHIRVHVASYIFAYYAISHREVILFQHL